MRHRPTASNPRWKLFHQPRHSLRVGVDFLVGPLRLDQAGKGNRDFAMLARTLAGIVRQQNLNIVFVAETIPHGANGRG